MTFASFSPRIMILALSLTLTARIMAAERPLELPPPLPLDLTPDACETSAPLTELSLQDAVKIALCKTPEIHQAHSAIAENTANLHVARSKYLPTLDANADGSRTGKHVRYPAYPAGNHDLHTYSGNARLGLSWLLFDSGRRRAQYDQAYAKLTAALYNKILVNRDQAITVANIYYKASSAKASAAAAHEAMVRAEKNYHAARRLREGGVGSIADELLAKVAWQRSLVDSETKATVVETMTINLITAIGLPGQTRISLPTTINTTDLPSHDNPIQPLSRTISSAQTRYGARSSDQDTSSQSVGERIIDAVHNHPRLAAARANTWAAEAETQSIQAEQRPVIRLQANREFGMTPAANAVIKQNINSWSVGLNVHIPLFDGLTSRYATDAARARVRTARETERAVWLQEEQKLLTDFSHMTSATQKIALLKDAEISANQAYRSAQVRYQQGVGTAIELIKAQDDLANLRQAVIDVHYERLATQFRLAVALDALPPIHH